MRNGLSDLLWAHHMDELAVFKKCADIVHPSWAELLDSLKFPDGHKTFKLIRARHKQAVEWFDMAVSASGLTGRAAFMELGMPPYLGSAFGVPHFTTWHVGPDKFERYVFEPASRLRWPSLRVLAIDLGSQTDRLYAPLKKDRPFKRRYFQHAIKRVGE